MTQSSNLGAVPTGTGATVRAAFNTGFQAVVTEGEGTGAPSPTWPFMLWRNDTTKLLKRRNAANSAWEMVVNYGATADPTVNDDTTDGWVRGSLWINTTGNKLFVCSNPADGAAAWKDLGAAAGTQAFGTIAVAGQSDVVADAAPDTLALVGANGVAITTTPGTDTITFAPTYGSSANTVCQGNDSRLSDTRTPTAHATSHKSGGGDAINVTEFGGFTTGKLAGRTTAGSGALEAITPSANLSLAGGTLDVTGPVASALGLTGAVSVNALTEDTAPDRAADFVVTYDTSAGGHKKVKPQNLIPYDILCGIVGKPSNGEMVLLFVAPRAFRVPVNAAGSYLKAGTAATGSSVFSIQKNGTQFLTATVAGAGTTATFSSSQTDFAAGDVLKVVAPATADATLADIAITLATTLL